MIAHQQTTRRGNEDPLIREQEGRGRQRGIELDQISHLHTPEETRRDEGRPVSRGLVERGEEKRREERTDGCVVLEGNASKSVSR